MRVSEDVMELVELLNDEGFGLLAGELLTEISLGRELDEGGDTADIGEFGDEKLVAFADERGFAREPIPENEQLRVALTFLRLRLVEPVKRMAEAEAIAGRLTEDQVVDRVPLSAAPAARILFTPVGDSRGERFERSEPAGETTTADELDQILNQLSG